MNLINKKILKKVFSCKIKDIKPTDIISTSICYYDKRKY